jgi:NitT/TauT family transport system permease protein
MTALHEVDSIVTVPRPRRARSARGWFAANWLSIVSAVVLLVFWETSARQWDFPYYPPLSKSIAAFWTLLLNGVILKALWNTLLALIIGLVLAVVLGIAIGTALGLSRTTRLALGPYIDGLMSAPMSAFVPLFILLFGLGIETRVIIVFIFAFFPIVVNTQAGMMAAGEDLIEMARSFGATRMEVFWKVRLPISHNHIATGLRMSMARGVDGNILGEVLIAAVGLGALVTQYGRSFSTDRLFAIVFVIIILSFAASKIMELLTRLLIPGRH